MKTKCLGLQTAGPRLGSFGCSFPGLLFLGVDFAYYGSQNDYTHIFIILELIFQLHRTSVTHGFLARNLLCNLGASKGIFCERAKYTR